MINGEPQYDMFAWDMARFGDWADKAFTKARVEDAYTHRFKIHFPNEERSAGRPARVRPAYNMQKVIRMCPRAQLRMGTSALVCLTLRGLRKAAGFTRQNWWEPVGREVRMLRENVGVIDISNFANYIIKGRGAYDWLNKLVANHVPTVIGRSCLTPLISVLGGVAGDFTITKVADDEYMMIGSGMAERYHQRYFNMVELPDDTTLDIATNRIAGFNVAGPKSRELLQYLTNADLTNEQFRFMRSRNIDVAGVTCLAIRVSFTGDLGWELHCAEKDQVQLYTALLDAAEKCGGGAVGGRALSSLRIEKGLWFMGS
jgi:dimethylglycine dehydrogenase